MPRWIMGIVCALLLATGASAAPGGMTLEQIAQTRAVTQAQISPDGRSIAYLLSVPRTLGVDPDGPARSELHVVDGAGTTRAFITGKVDIASPRWLPDGRSIAYLAKREGDDTRRLYTIPLQGGESTVAAQLRADITAFDLSPDGRQVAVLAVQRESDARKALRDKGFSQKVYEEDWRPVELWITDIGGTCEPRRIEIDGSVQSVRWSPAGDRLAVVVTPRQLTDDTMVDARVRMLSVQGRELGRVDKPGKLGEMAWRPDGAHLAIVSAADENDPREGRLTVVGRDGGAPRHLLPGPEGHVWNVAWRDASTLVFLSQEGVQSRLAEIRADGSAQRTLLPAAGAVHMGLSVAPGGAIALVGSTPAHP